MSKELTAPMKRKRRISVKLRRAIELLASRTTIQSDAAARANLSPEYLSRALAKPEIRELLDEKTRTFLLKGKLRAAARSVELLDSESDHVAADMTRWHLGVHGIRPAESPTININNTNNLVAGYIVDLGPDPDPSPIFDVTPESSS